MTRLRASAILALVAILLVGCPGLTGTGGTVIPGGSSGGGSSGGGSSGGGSSGGGSSGGGTTATDAGQVLTLVNAERASAGLPALTRNAQLDAAAAAHAADMSANSFFDHTGSTGSSVADRATAAGYVWTKVGENIGQGDVTPAEMMNLWMNSAGHRANILDPDFTEIGIAVDGTGTTLWVQVFGRP